MNNKYFSDIYDDFFKVEEKEINVEEANNNDDINILDDIILCLWIMNLKIY